MSSIMTIRAPEKMRTTLLEIARKEGLTRNALILTILRDWIKNHPNP